MAHFASLDENNIVTAVNVIANSDCLDGDGNESEAVGITFCKSLWGDDTIWKQTSYNDNFKKQYAAVGGKYDPVRNEFIDPQPFSSWTLSATNDWTPPKAKPDDGKDYLWDESAYQADNEDGWVEEEGPS